LRLAIAHYHSCGTLLTVNVVDVDVDDDNLLV